MNGDDSRNPMEGSPLSALGMVAYVRSSGEISC